MSSQTVVTIILGIVEIVSFSIMSRILSQEDFGYYAAITAITTVFASFSETGIGAAIVQRKELTKQYTDNAFTLSLLFGAFIAFALIILSRPLSSAVLNESMMLPLMLMSITLFCNCLTSVNNSIMQRKLQFLRMGLINLIALVITTIVAVILAVKGLGYYAILAKAILTSIITLVLSYIGAQQKYSLALDRSTFKTIFGFSGWLMASVFFRNFAQQIDKLLMGRLLSVDSLGAYNRPKEFINQISSKVEGIFDTALFPVLSGIQDDNERIKNAYLRSYYYINIFAVVMTLGFVVNAEFIIRLFFGVNWMNLLLTFQILSCVLIFSADGRLADCYLRSLGWTKQQFYFRIVEVILKIIGLIIGYSWEIIGVAVSFVITTLISIIIKNIYISIRIGISTTDTAKTLFDSWRIVVFMLPILIFALNLLPHTLCGEIAVLVLYMTLLAIAFIALPSIVGERYKNEIYGALIKRIKKAN